MKTYRRVVPPLAATGGGSASDFASLMVERLRSHWKGQPKAELDDWEGDGGRVAATDTTVTRK